MSGFIAPYSPVMDCTSQTSPNSPIPSAGKGRYYTQWTDSKHSRPPTLDSSSMCLEPNITGCFLPLFHSAAFCHQTFCRWEPSWHPSAWNISGNDSFLCLVSVTNHKFQNPLWPVFSKSKKKNPSSGHLKKKITSDFRTFGKACFFWGREIKDGRKSESRFSI